MPAITFEGVSKRYQLGSGQRNLRDVLPGGARKWFRDNGKPTASNSELLALNAVSFAVEPGEVLGLVGANGAGKSTILKLLSKVTQPTSGHISVSGRISALIELGAGFHPDLTGRENIYLSGSILGLTRRDIEHRFESIVEFSELAEFLDTPVKRYSSGMYVRLGFAVAVHVDPEVLLIDEVLSVGDVRFRDKCNKHIDSLRRSGTTMVIVSHDRHMLERLCDRGLLIHRGRLIADGPIGDVLDHYYRGIHRSFEGFEAAFQSVQSGPTRPPIEITGVTTCDRDGRERDTFLTGEGMLVRIQFRANAVIEEPVFYCDVLQDRTMLNGSNSARFSITSGTFEPGQGGIVEVSYDALNLLEGEYSISAGITQDILTQIKYHAVENAAVFRVNSSIRQGFGVVHLPQQWALQRIGYSQVSSTPRDLVLEGLGSRE